MSSKLRLRFQAISEDSYLWGVREMGDSQRKRGCYELGWEPYSKLPDGTQTFTVYRRIGASCSRSLEAITLAEFLSLPVLTTPTPVINAMAMDLKHRSAPAPAVDTQ